MNADPIIALLKGVEDNHTLHMSYKQQNFVCRPYGIETIGELMERVDVNSSCKAHLQEFRSAHPQEKAFAWMTLHVQQQYSVEGVQQDCILLLSGRSSYNEALLEAGYARLKRDIHFKEELLKYRFDKAVGRAMNTQSGMWSDRKVRECFLLRKKRR